MGLGTCWNLKPHRARAMFSTTNSGGQSAVLLSLHLLEFFPLLVELFLKLLELFFEFFQLSLGGLHALASLGSGLLGLFPTRGLRGFRATLSGLLGPLVRRGRFLPSGTSRAHAQATPHAGTAGAPALSATSHAATTGASALPARPHFPTKAPAIASAWPTHGVCFVPRIPLGPVPRASRGSGALWVPTGASFLATASHASAGSNAGTPWASTPAQAPPTPTAGAHGIASALPATAHAPAASTVPAGPHVPIVVEVQVVKQGVEVFVADIVGGGRFVGFFGGWRVHVLPVSCAAWAVPATAGKGRALARAAASSACPDGS